LVKNAQRLVTKPFIDAGRKNKRMPSIVNNVRRHQHPAFFRTATNTKIATPSLEKPNQAGVRPTEDASVKIYGACLYENNMTRYS